jgi:uncharacterized protein
MSTDPSRHPTGGALRRSGLVLGLVVAAVFCRPAMGAAPAGAPRPYGQQAAGLPMPGGWVTDLAGAFDQQNRENLLALSVELEKKTTAELAVVTVDSLRGESIESYSTRLFNYWGVGKSGYNNGVLLVFSMQDRRMRIAVGDGLTSLLPDDLCQQIIDDTIAPFFKAGRYGDGAYAGAARVAEVLSAHYGVSLQTLSTHRPPRLNVFSRVGAAVARFLKALGWIIVFPIYIVLRLLFGRTAWWESIESSSSGGWSSGWGGSGGFGGGFSSGGGASGSW